jgi:hypothetical protein
MGAYDQFYLGWAKETVPGTSTIVNAASTAYLIGTTSQTTPLPDPEWQYFRVPPAWGERATSSIKKTQATPTSSGFGFCPHNGVPFWFIMGKSSTAGTVHTLTTASQSAGVIAQLPSLTLHAERVDNSAILSDWVVQYSGVRNVAARIFCGDKEPILTCSYGWMGMNAAKQVFSLTNKPADVTGTYTSPKHYLWNGSTHKYDGTTIEGITSWEIRVTNNTFSVPGVYGSKFPSAVYQGPQQEIDLTVRYRPSVTTLHDDLLATTVPSKNWTFEFVRHATDDRLLFTCTTAGTMKHPTLVPNAADEFEVEMEIAVTSLTISVTDQINKSFYGE